MRLLLNCIGIVLLVAALWEGMDGRLVAAVVLAVAVVAIAFARVRF